MTFGLEVTGQYYVCNHFLNSLPSRMERFTVTWVGFLLLFQGFSALTPVFVQTGEDVVLDGNGANCSEDGAAILWRFSQKENLVRLTCWKDKKPTVSKLEYQDRTEITEETSLKLKNCQKSFSGVYSARRSFKKDEVVAEYNVTVEDPVSPVLLNVDSVFNSSNFCNLTVTCSTDHSHISSSFTCGSESCKQDDGQQTNVTKQENLLQVYLSDDSVICNHSNHVSWANSTEKIRLICLRHNDDADQTGHGIWVIIGGCFIALVIIVGAIFLGKKILTYFKGCCAKGPKNPESAALQAPPNQPPGSEDALSETCKSVYSVVQPHLLTTSPGNEANKVPESVYAHVEKPKRAKSPPTLKAPGDQRPGPEDAPSDSKTIYSCVQPHLQTTNP